jgi:Arc/MetJ-type ribon-helix-helix transcriptional regulator
MGRKIKGVDGTKSQKITIRVDEALRKRIEAFVKSGPFEGEELQSVIRMLIRQGLAVQEKFKEVLEGIEAEISRKAASWARRTGQVGG